MLTVNTKLSEHQNAGGVSSEYLDDSLLQDYHQFQEIERLKNISDRERRFLEDSHSYWTEDTGQKSQIFSSLHCMCSVTRLKQRTTFALFDKLIRKFLKIRPPLG